MGQRLRRFAITRFAQAAVYLVLSSAFLIEGRASGGQAGVESHRFHETHAAMGTEFAIDLYAKDEASAEQALSVAFDEIDRLEELLSNYRPSSELSRISRDAGYGPVTTDPETFQFLQRSLYWSERSDGAFDITVGPLLREWGFYQHGGASAV